MTSLSNMYCIDKNAMERSELSALKKELTLQPKKFDGFAFGERGDFPIYMERNGLIMVPRYFGLKRYGMPDKMLTHSEEVKFSFKGELRDKQKKPYKQFREKWQDSAYHGIFEATCGYGKTIIALKLIAEIGQKTLVLVHKGDLMDQWIGEAETFLGITPGILKQDKCESDLPLVIGMIQSVARRDYPINAGMIVMDECHHLPAETFWSAVCKLNPTYLLGLSGTVRRSDGLESVITNHIGPSLVVAKSGVKATVYFKTVPCNLQASRYTRILRGKPRLNLSKLITDISEIPARNKVLVSEMLKANKKGRRFLALSGRRDHLKLLKEMYDAEGGTSSGLYMGQMKKTDLDANRECKALFGTYQFAAEGTDIPTVDCIFLCTPKSDVEQSIGRGLRELDGKKQLVIVDFLDRSLGVLIGFSKKRIKIYNRLKFEVN